MRNAQNGTAVAATATDKIKNTILAASNEASTLKVVADDKKTEQATPKDSDQVKAEIAAETVKPVFIPEPVQAVRKTLTIEQIKAKTEKQVLLLEKREKYEETKDRFTRYKLSASRETGTLVFSDGEISFRTTNPVFIAKLQEIILEETEKSISEIDSQLQEIELAA
ncbi:MAG: hypothetical protein ACXWEY_13945 [Bacteroidia bacterium]